MTEEDHEKALTLAEEHTIWATHYKHPVSGGLLGWTCDDPEEWLNLTRCFAELSARYKRAQEALISWAEQGCMGDEYDFCDDSEASPDEWCEPCRAQSILDLLEGRAKCC